MKRFFVTVFALALCLFNYAQSLSKKEINDLQTTIRLFLDKQGAFVKDHSPRKPEVILLLLDIDSIGRVADIHLLMDIRNRDTVGTALAKLSATDFTNWRPDSCRNKVVIQPIAGLGVGLPSTESKYAELLFSGHVNGL